MDTAAVQESILDFGSKFFADGLVLFLIRAVLIFVIVRALREMIHRAIKRIPADDASTMQLSFLDSTLKYVLYTIGTFMVLSRITFLAGLGSAALGATSIISVVLGLAAQDAMGNFIAGFFLALTHPFKTGDVISLPDMNITGRVLKVNARHTVLLTADQEKIIVPNSTMNTAVIKDLDYDQPYYSCLIELSVAYESDTDLVRKAILEAIEASQGVLDLRTPEEKKEGAAITLVRFSDFLDSGIKVSFRIAVKDFGSSFAVSSNVRESILKKFNDYGIEIPYNKLQLVNPEE